MEKLCMIDFPTDTIRLDVQYKNIKLLKEMVESGGNKETPPKIAEVYDQLIFPEAPANRPYLLSSIVLSADGKMAFEDISEGPAIAKQNFLDPDGALADFWILNALRAYSDAVVIGARTLQIEPKATGHVFDPELLAQRRETLGKPNHPTNIVASFDGTDIPMDHLIFNIDPAEGLPVAITTSPSGAEYLSTKFPRPVHVYGPYETAKAVEAEGISPQLSKDIEPGSGVVPIIVTGKDNMPETPAFLSVSRKLGMEIALIESPSFTAHLMELELMDEFFIDYSMVYAGGNLTPGRSIPQSSEAHPHAQLVTLATHNSSFMYTRQKLYYGLSPKVDLSRYR